MLSHLELRLKLCIFGLDILEHCRQITVFRRFGVTLDPGGIGINFRFQILGNRGGLIGEADAARLKSLQNKRRETKKNCYFTEKGIKALDRVLHNL